MADIPRRNISTDAEITWVRLQELSGNPDNANAADHFNFGINGTTLTWVDELGNVYTAASGSSLTPPITFSGATATNTILTLKSTDNSATNPLLKLVNSSDASQTLLYYSGAATFNEAGNDADFRVEGDTATHLVFVDASVDRVGINNSSPQNPLDVNGRFQQTSPTGVDGNKGIILTGSALGGANTSTDGIVIGLSNNSANNRQLLLFDSTQGASASFYGFRFIVGFAVPTIDGVRTNVSAVANINIGQTTANVGIGFSVASAVQASITAKLHILGSGTSTGKALFVEDSAGTDRFQVLDNGFVSIGLDASGNGTKLSIHDSNAATNAVVNVMNITTNSTGTAAAGFGTGFLFEAESSTTDNTTQGRIRTAWITATHASRAARMTFSAYDTAERDCIAIEASGTVSMIGFNGVAPTAQSTGWSVTNPVTRKSYDTTTITLPQLAEVVGTIITYLKLRGDFGA